MSISLITGVPGSGKSYTAVDDVFNFLKSGRKVITNLSIKIEMLPFHMRDLLKIVDDADENGDFYFSKVEHYQDDWRHPDTNIGCAIIIDEAQRFLHRDAKPSHDLFILYTKHRHMGLDIFLLTQSHDYIDRKFARLVDSTVALKSLDALGDTKHYLEEIYHQLPESRKEPFRKNKRKYQQEIFDLYTSHTLSDQTVLEQNHRKAGNPMKRLAYIFILLTICGIIFSVRNFVSLADDSAESFSSINDDAPFLDSSSDVQISNSVIDYHSFDKNIENGINSASNSLSNVNTRESLLDLSIYDLPSFDKRENIDTSIEDVKRAPYYDYEFILSGFIKFPKSNISIMYFKARNKSRNVTTEMTSLELVQSGYKLTQISNCVVLIDHEYQPSSQYAICERDQSRFLQDEKIEPELFKNYDANANANGKT